MVLDADDCETSGHEGKPHSQEWQWRHMKRPEQRDWQQTQHILRLSVGNCRATEDDIEAMHDERLSQRLQTVICTAVYGTSGRTSRALLHSVAGGFLRNDSRGQCAMETRDAALSSFVFAPAGDGLNSLSLDTARGQSFAAGLATNRLVGAVAGAEVRLGDKAAGRIGAPVYNGCLGFAPFENFFESPFPEDSSDPSVRSHGRSACTLFSSGSVGRSAALCHVVNVSAARVIAEDPGEPQAANSRRLPRQEEQTNEEAEQGRQPESHEKRHLEEPHQQEGALWPSERLEQVPSRERGGQKAVRSIGATQKVFAETGSFLCVGRPELLRDKQPAAQVRVLLRDPTTGAAQERMVQVLLIHRNPEIFYIPELLTDAECDHLIEICRGRWERSKTSTGYATADPREYSSINSANRTSFSVPLEAGETLGVEIVERLVAAFADMNLENLEPLVIVRYEPGQCFKAHHDGGFRPKTLLLYLNDVEEGGETSFENLGFCITPAKRAGVLWANAFPGTNMIDPRMLHAGLPPSKGTKYVVNCFFNKDPVRLPATRTLNVPSAITPCI